MASGPVNFDELFGPMGPGRVELDELVKSVSALSRNTKLLAKNLDADGQRIGAGLAAITSQTQALRERTTQLTLTTDAERASLASLGTQVAQLAQQQQQQIAALAGQATVRKAATEADKEATSALKALQTELKAAFAANDAERVLKAATAVRQYKADTDQLNKAIRGANSELTAVAGSYNRLTIETQQLGERIRALPGGFDAASAEANKLKKEFADNTQKLKDFDRELNQNFREVGSYAKGILEAVAALEKQKGAISGELSALKNQANATHLSADEQARLRSEIQKTEVELGKVTTELKQYGTAAKQSTDASKTNIQKAGGMAEAYIAASLGVAALTSAIGKVFNANAEYSDQLADVRKTTGLTRVETDGLATSLKKLDTRTSLSGLLDIAQVGGQLGVAGKDIAGFTKSIDVSVQALGDDFKGGAEEIATNLGKINTVFKQQLGPDLPENLLHIGSALNQLGAEGAATAPQLADVALRVGAVAANAGLGLDKVLAYAAVLQEVGFDAEVSGTALNKLLNGLSSKPKEYFAIAKLADSNLTLKQFTHLINNDVDGALKLFLKGLNTGGTSTTKFSQLVGTLGLKSGATVSVLTTLAKNTELVAERQASANEQLLEGNSLAEEAALKNNNLAGSWEKLKNDVANFFTSGTGASALKWFVDAARGALNLREGLGKTFGLVKDVSTSEALLEASRQQVALTTDAGTAAGLAAAKAGELYQQYQALAGVQNRSAEQQRQLNTLTLQLRDTLGSKVAVIDQETGAYKLNTAAVEAAISGQQGLKKAQAETLAKQLETIEAQLRAGKALKEAKSNEVDTRQNLLAGTGFDLNQAERQTANLGPNITPASLNSEQGTRELAALNLSREQALALLALRDATRSYGQAVQQVEQQEAQRAQVLAGLLKLGYSESEALALLGNETKKTTKATDDSLAADKKKKQTVADLAKEEAALAKQRLEARLAELTRQADNPANSEAVRADALRKAAQVRIQIAKVERDELIHEAALRFKDQVGGAAALGVATIRLTEAFSAKRLGIERETDKSLVALHNGLLDQLAEIDKLTIESELVALDKIAGNEQASFAARQQAAADAAARRIELVAITADKELRAAQGNAEKITAIQLKQAADTRAILAGEKAFDSEKANQGVAIDYEGQQLELEQARAKGLVTEAAYTEQVRGLHLTQLREELANLETGVDNERAIAAKKLEIAKAEGDEKVRIASETEQQRQQIIQASFATLSTFADAYFSIERDAAQAAGENLQQQKQQELQVAGDNAELKAQIEEKFRKKELEAKRKQAQLDRQQALFNVALNTAQAVTSVLSTGGGTRYADFGISAGILSALVIAQGLAQTVAILAKPLPNYFVGRASGPREKAIVAEQGPELIGQPGSFRLAATQGIAQLEAGDRVYTAPETRDALRGHELVAGRLVARQAQADQQQQASALRVVNGGRAVGEAAEARAAVEARERDTDRLIAAWHSRPEQRLTADGLREWTRAGDAWTEHVQSRYRRNG